MQYFYTSFFVSDNVVFYTLKNIFFLYKHKIINQDGIIFRATHHCILKNIFTIKIQYSRQTFIEDFDFILISIESIFLLVLNSVFCVTLCVFLKIPILVKK